MPSFTAPHIPEYAVMGGNQRWGCPRWRGPPPPQAPAASAARQHLTHGRRGPRVQGLLSRTQGLLGKDGDAEQKEHAGTEASNDTEMSKLVAKLKEMEVSGRG